MRESVGTGGLKMADRDRLIELLQEARDKYNNLFFEKELIADHLLANGVIVQKQGEWKVHQNNEYWHYDCPFCDDGYATKGKDETPPNYCGNCGAKMDGKDGAE
jgi:hypothetical protein